MNTLNAPIKLVWNTNDIGELCSVKIENEEMTIESNLGLLDQIPDRTYGVFIERFENDSWVPMTEVKSNLTELDANSYRVDWDAGWLWFSSEKPVGRIRATYWGRGFFLISDKRLYTEIDRNEDGSYNYESLYNLFEGIRNMRYVGEFDPAESYKVNNQVFYQGSAYIKTEDGESEDNLPPKEDIANWDLLAVGFNPMGAYNESTKYYPGDVVYVESENYSNLYLCKQPVEGVNPETNDENNSWQLLFDTSFLDTKLVLDIDYSEMDMTVEDGIYRVKAGNDTGTLNGYLMVLRYDEPGVSLDGGDATIHTCRQIYFGKYIKNTDPDAAPFITSSFSIQFREGEIDEGTGNLTKEWTKGFAYQPGSTILSNYQILGLNGRIPKERLVNPDGGFEVGDNASATGGTAIGKGATSNAGGCAVGENAWADTGAAIGKNAFCAGNGGAVGVGTSAVHGFAGGGNAKVVWSGGAVGSGAYAGNGFSGGLNAKVEDTEDGPVDAIQLGTGTNNHAKTLQVYNYQLMDAEGHVPIDRLALIKQYVDALLENNVLTKTNTIPYAPTMPYHPATKAYVDAHCGGGGSGGGSNRNYALHSKEDIPASRQAGDIFFIWDGFDSTTPIDPPVQNMQAVQYTNMVISVDEPENAEYWGKIVSESKEGTSDIPVSDIVSGDMEVAEEPSGTKIFFNKIK